MSTEPSMEEILSSIKRIIAEEGESPIRGRRAGRAAPLPPPERGDDEGEAEILELSHPILPAPLVDEEPDRMPAARTPAPVSEAPPRAATAEPAASPAPEPAAAAAAEPIVSSEAAAASRTALDSLSRLMVKPEPSGDGTLEGLVREMLRPMLRDWLDTNLPPMVETMVQAEIKRITGQPR